MFRPSPRSSDIGFVVYSTTTFYPNSKASVKSRGRFTLDVFCTRLIHLARKMTAMNNVAITDVSFFITTAVRPTTPHPHGLDLKHGMVGMVDLLRINLWYSVLWYHTMPCYLVHTYSKYGMITPLRDQECSRKTLPRSMGNVMDDAQLTTGTCYRAHRSCCSHAHTCRFRHRHPLHPFFPLSLASFCCCCYIMVQSSST